MAVAYSAEVNFCQFFTLYFGTHNTNWQGICWTPKHFLGT